MQFLYSVHVYIDAHTQNTITQHKHDSSEEWMRKAEISVPLSVLKYLILLEPRREYELGYKL